MLIAIIGESCVGKSMMAEVLRNQLNAQVYTGKDYLRLAKSESVAQKLFQKQLEEAVHGSHLIYVIAQKEHIRLLPEGAVKVLMTADLSLIQERFAARMGGTLLPTVQQMLQRKHGCFDDGDYDYSIHNCEAVDIVCEAIVKGL